MVANETGDLKREILLVFGSGIERGWGFAKERRADGQGTDFKNGPQKRSPSPAA